jgi:hypothetical protein
MAPTTTTTTTVPEEEAEPYTEAVRFEQEVPEETPPAPLAPTVQAADVLPRTGADAGVAARFATGALVLAMACGRIRRRART